jgi:hypothetical protein
MSLFSIERAAISDTGDLSSFSFMSALSTARDGHVSVVAGSFVYVAAGFSSSINSYLRSVERAPIAADGTLGAFVDVPGVMLASPRGYSAGALIGSYLYLIGGSVGADGGSTAWYDDAERALIQ